MNWEPVNSSFVEALAHEDDAMYVRFSGGAEYRYDGIGYAEFERIKESASVGSEVRQLSGVRV